MFFTSLLITALAISNTSAPSLPKRVSAPTVDDGIILNFALTLEFLQRAFYEDALAQFTHADFVAAGFADPVYANLQAVYFDERSHVEFLTLALLAAGIEPTGELEYEFPYTDVASFVGLASVIEGVSVSAYLGALSSIEDPDYMTAFGSILGVEARQSSSIRAGLGEAPFPNPFDTPLDFNEAHSLALPFITNFNSGPVKLPFTAFPSLTLQCAPDYYEAGRFSVTFTGAFAAAEKLGVTKDTDVFAVFISGLLKLPVLAQITNNYSDYMVDEIPIGVSGQAYVVLSNSCIDPSDENIIAGPAVLEASCLRSLNSREFALMQSRCIQRKSCLLRLTQGVQQSLYLARHFEGSAKDGEKTRERGLRMWGKGFCILELPCVRPGFLDKNS